ncbi:hypothetical protein VPNG_00857 [Cytospora leucostoma]|uniref:enoyl-[acyl-carrier-protein] reductase n=1 Tax=Cytospora leucostoma TaxID=1230097 RepID=A0A423XM41_9PEZI|nr:hypothetical protein VPNG_00857 [Cytospora leucostoma]
MKTPLLTHSLSSVSSDFSVFQHVKDSHLRPGHRSSTDSNDNPTIPHLSSSSRNEALVQFLAAPINRVDLMVLNSKYPVRPKHHLDSRPVPGFDGCGVVLESTSPDLSKGDMVIPRDLGLGTWRTHAVLPAASLIGVPAATPPLAGALLRSGVLIAWLLLHRVRVLQEGDAVIVSAGTSTVAWFLVQLARLMRVSVFLVVRDRGPDELRNVRDSLLELGAAAVISESELRESLAREAPVPTCLPVRPILALDSVFGPVGQLLVETLAPGGTFVLVGLLGGPGPNIQIDSTHLFDRRLSFLPFRGSEVIKSIGHSKVEELLNDLATMFLVGRLKTPKNTIVSWSDTDDQDLDQILTLAIESAASDSIGYRKTIFEMS